MNPTISCSILFGRKGLSSFWENVGIVINAVNHTIREKLRDVIESGPELGRTWVEI